MTAGIPEYSERAKIDRDVLFDELSSVHFFVEDECMHSFYEILFARLFPKIDSFTVFALNGKDTVLQHAKSVAKNVGSAIKIYIVDLDFDDILGTMFVQENVFYLDDYSIETSVVDEASLNELCVEERPRLRRRNIIRTLDVGATLSGWLPSLDSLHRGFALVQKYSLGIANVGQAPERFTLGGSRCQLSDERIGAYRNQVAGELVNRGVIGDGSEFAGLSKQIFPSRLPSLKHISGKFLLRLWFHRMKLCGLIGNVSQDSLLIRCARTSKLRRLRSVRTRVNRYVSGRLTDRKAVK